MRGLVAIVFCLALLVTVEQAVADATNPGPHSSAAAAGGSGDNTTTVIAPGPPVAPETGLGEVAATCKALGEKHKLCKLGTKVYESRYTRARLFVVKYFGWIPFAGPRL